MIAKGLPGNGWKTAGLAAGIMLMLACLALSVMLGATPIRVADAVRAVTDYDSGVNEQIIVRTTRVPRALIAAAIGACLAVAGALMQAMTRNPLASPGVLGINAAATLAVVLAITVVGVGSMTAQAWVCFAGAAVGASIVYALGSLGAGGLSPMRIVLAGSAMTALFASMTQWLLVLNENGLNDVLYWLMGSIAGRPIGMLEAVSPYMLVGLLGSFLLARQINILVLGDDAASGLGQRTGAIRLICGLIIVLLAGSSVAVAGPIGFIGIVIPHVARHLSGMDYRWLLPYSAVLGAVLLLLADLAARFVMMPLEVPAGVLTAVIGTPFFIYVARRARGEAAA